MDIASIIGLALGIVAVFGGALMEGLPLAAILQLTAFIIVILGSLGAMLLSTPVDTLILGSKMIKDLFIFNTNQGKALAELILAYADKARKDGLLALEDSIEEVPHPFLKKALRCALDGYDPDAIVEVMETQISIQEQKETDAGKMWEVCGGYAPTIGIIGAVLGLIVVMGGLSAGGEGGTEALGSGIAVAFVATIYGVGSANLIFIPFGGKMKSRAAYNKKLRMMMLTGVLGIVQGLHPLIIQDKIKPYYE